ncbi:MAG: AbgT family transporter, partial [Candidatus Krumholzibacteria bacterium]|nr:AbgT family transporter [Candidatus Krumholzibacteria bacterium]
MTIFTPRFKNKFGSAKLISGFLGMIEKGGNALPHPASLFAIMAFLAVVGSGITSFFDLS